MIGMTLGPCVLQAELGRGATGVVYRAHHINLDRPVAVKVLMGLPESALKEARTAAKLDDPRIVRVLDAGQQDGKSFIIMQLVTGQTLQDLVASAGPMPPKEALRLMKEVVRGLKLAHSQGVIHRDIKPANIMVGDDGMPRIMDFGLAATSTASGTWDYMAPEQGFGASSTPRMDLYSFGATWFFTLAGRPPFVSKQRSDLLIMHRESPVPDVREHAKSVTRLNAALIDKLMAKEPDARPATAEEVLGLMESHGMVIDVDASGSPFVLLPPPLDEKPDLPPAPEPAAVAADQNVEAAAAPAPPPPPPVENVSPWPARVGYGLLFLAVFGRHWFRPLGSFDAAAGAVLALLIPWRGPQAAVMLTGLMACSFFGPAALMGSFEASVAFGLSVVLIGASLALEGLLRRLLLLAGLALGLYAASGGDQVVLLMKHEVFLVTGGYWRWGGLLLLSLWWMWNVPDEKPKPAAAVGNWYRSKKA